VPTKVEVSEVDQDLTCDKGAKLESTALHQSELNAPLRSEVVEAEVDD
jgi:hypothetical protein